MKPRVVIGSLSLVAFGLAGTATQAAGKIEVSFVEPTKFSDIGWPTLDRERNLRVLQEHLQSLAARLPDGQTLKLEITDVDLAGDVKPFLRFSLGEVRVLKGSADWPRMELRYNLVGSDGAVLQSGSERVMDMAYQMRSLPPMESGSDLAYDKRMLSQWFERRFVTGGASAKPV
jgi:hypothetical protein